MEEPKLYKGEPVSFFKITKEMEVSVEGLTVTPVTTQPGRTFHGIGASVRVSGRAEAWIIRFRSNQKLDKDGPYWIPLPNQNLTFHLGEGTRQQDGQFLYDVKVEL